MREFVFLGIYSVISCSQSHLRKPIFEVFEWDAAVLSVRIGK